MAPGTLYEQSPRNGADDVTEIECLGVFRVALAELEAMPTLAQGHTANLKIETEGERVWLSRGTVADGDPWANHVFVERLLDGAWVTVENWRAE